MGKNKKETNKTRQKNQAHGEDPDSRKTALLSGQLFSKISKKVKGSPLGKYLPGQSANTNIRRQLLVPLITFVVFVGIIGGLVSYLIGARMTTNQLVQSTGEQLKAINSEFETYFGDAQSVVRQFTASKLLNDANKNEDLLNQSFQNVLSSNTKYQAITYANENKKAIRAPLFFFRDNYDPTKEPWYQDGAKGKGKSIWTDPYTDVVTKQSVVSVTQAVMDQGQVKGVVKLDLFMLSITNQIRNSKIGQSGYAALLDQSGHYIATPKNIKAKSAADQDFYKKMKKMGNSGHFYAKIDGKNKLINFQRNKTTGWTLIGVIDKSEISHQANLVVLPSAITIVLIIVFAILITSYLLRKVIIRLRSVQRAAKRVEQGDLTVGIPVQGNDEIAELTKSINQMARVNREAFKKMTGVTQQIAGASQTLVASAEENVASTNEISATVTQIAAGASNQASALDANQTAIRSLIEQAKTMDRKSKEVLDGASDMSTTSKGGKAKMQHLSEQSKASAETTGQIIHAVTTLQKHAANVHKVIDVLDGIARRTNLLSLNASIEAAHAGESGKGFAVVAGEIRKLAQQTNHSLSEVTDTIRSMTKETAHAVELCEQTSTMIRSQQEAVAETNNAFARIEETIKQNIAGVQKMAESIQKIQEHIEEIGKGSQSIAATSEETAASTEEVSASVEEQTAAMEELNKLAGDLDQQAQLMKQAIDRYKI